MESLFHIRHSLIYRQPRRTSLALLWEKSIDDQLLRTSVFDNCDLARTMLYIDLDGNIDLGV
jgi:hypothetical protein